MIVDDGKGEEFQHTEDATSTDRDISLQPQRNGTPQMDTNKPKKQYQDVLAHNDLSEDNERPAQRIVQSNESVKIEEVPQEC